MIYIVCEATVSVLNQLQQAHGKRLLPGHALSDDNRFAITYQAALGYERVHFNPSVRTG